MREWLKRDLAKLAYQKALTRAYTAFARQHPELAASLFDSSFLAKEAAPELAKQLARHQHPDPAHLTRLWVESFRPALSDTPEDRQQKQALIAQYLQPVADFLRWPEAELKAEPVFQPLFDSRALESLPAIEAKLDTLIAELQRGLEAALKAAEQYRPIVTIDAHTHNVITITNVPSVARWASAMLAMSKSARPSLPRPLVCRKRSK